MTDKQKRWYWGEWNAAKKVLVASGYTPAEAEEWRRDCPKQALGVEKSSKDFTSRDLDMVLQYFRGVSRPDDFDGQIALQEGERRRLIEGIRKDSPGTEWLAVVTHDIYGHTRWESLPVGDLIKLRRRCANAKRAAKMKADAAAALAALAK